MDDVLMDKLLNTWQGSMCIAGGYVRDTLLDVPPRDVDVFVVVPSDKEWEEFVDAMSKLGYVWTPVKMAARYGAKYIKETGSFDHPTLYSGKSPMEINITVLMAKEFFAKIGHPVRGLSGATPSVPEWEYFICASFDYGLCMAFQTHEGDVITTPPFMKDYLNKTLTLYTENIENSPWQCCKSITTRRKKLLAKYPDYEVKVV